MSQRKPAQYQTRMMSKRAFLQGAYSRSFASIRGSKTIRFPPNHSFINNVAPDELYNLLTSGLSIIASE